MISTSFASIVSLLGQFRSEHQAKSQADYNEFLEWLIKTDHEELRNLITLNTNAAISIKAILKQDRDVLLDKLESLDKALTQFASSIDGFSELAISIKPNSSLSPQAVEILMQYEARSASKLLELRGSNGLTYLFLDGGGELAVTDNRFIEDDFNTLTELGLLRHDINSQGNNLYLYTRTASSLVSSINGDS